MPWLRTGAIGLGGDSLDGCPPMSTFIGTRSGKSGELEMDEGILINGASEHSSIFFSCSSSELSSPGSPKA